MQKHPGRAAVPMFLCLLAGAASADPWDAPAFYYAGINATNGLQLKQQLHDLIDNHVVRSYGTAVPALRLTEQDPDDASKIRLIYTPWSVTNVWDPNFWWNREHTWPKSRGVGESGADTSDLHQLRPCDPSINSVRGNDPFGEFGGSYWDPNFYGATDRGEIARTMFYMAVRYDGSDAGTTDLELVNGIPFGNTMGDLASLLRWHYREMPDELERRRNHYIYDSSLMPFYYQGNRNPFVDRPEYVWAIWGGGANDSRITIAGEQPVGGATSRTLTAPPRLVGQPAPEWNVTLSKIGADPTTYTVTTTGDASASVPETARAFDYNNGAFAMTVGLSGSGAGSYSGAVTIDNTDLTSSGGGRGSQDGDDVITMAAEVLSPAQPSLDPSSPTLERIVDFGPVERLSGDLSVIESIWNLASVDPQAALQLAPASFDLGPGASASVPTNDRVAAGASAPVSVTFDTAAPEGVVEAVVTVPTADDPGVLGWQLRGDVVLTVRIELVANACPGDLTNDATVNADDLLAVLAAFGEVGESAWTSDLTGDGAVNADDLLGVLAAFGTTCP